MNIVNKFKKLAVGSVMTSMVIGAFVTSATADQLQSFKDVDSSFWGYSAIIWGVQQKITSGYEDSTFRPNKTVTEEEFVTLLVRAFGGASTSGEEKRYSDPYYRLAQEKNLPVSDNRTGTITRQTVANIIAGTQGVNFTGDDAVQYMLLKGLTKGKTAPTIEGYKGQDTLTRVEAIAFIKNVIDKVENKTILTRPQEPSPKSLLVTSDQKESGKQNNADSQVNKKISLDMFMEKFNQAAKEFNLTSNQYLVKEKFTLNSSYQDNIVYDYYPDTDPTNPMERSAFGIYFDKKTGDFVGVKATVTGTMTNNYITSIISAVYQDSAKGNEIFTSNKMADAIQKAQSDKNYKLEIKLGNCSLSYVYRDFDKYNKIGFFDIFVE
jgi:hypothetical protein